MANPNIVNVTSILGKTDTFALTTALTALVTCTTDKVFKVNTIMAANIDGTNAQNITITVRTDASTDKAIASTVSVPADATLVVSDKNSFFYLEEGDILKGQAGSNSDIELLVSYEIIDDA